MMSIRKIAGVCGVAMGLALACALAAPEAENLVKNPGFETQDISAWKSSVKDKAKFAFERVEDADLAHAGKAALKMTFQYDKPVNFYHFRQHVAVEPNTAYTFGVYMKTDLAAGNIKIEILDKKGWKVFAASTKQLAGKQDWTLLTARFKTKAETTDCIIRVRHTQRKTSKALQGTVWMDDLKLQKTPPKKLIKHTAG